MIFIRKWCCSQKFILSKSFHSPLEYLCRKEFLPVLYQQSRHWAFFCEELDSDSCSAPAQTVSRTPPTQSEVRWMLIVVAWGSNPDNFFLHQIDTNMNDAWVGWYSIILNHNIIRYSSILWSLSSLIETCISDVGIGSHLQLHSYWVLLWC